MFSEAEEKVIKEKLEQLTRVKRGTLSPHKLAALIARRRIAWIKEHLDEMLVKYRGLSPEEQAYKIVFFEHMGIDPKHSKIVRISPRKIKIISYNFCPYLEACKQLRLDTKFVCKEIGEQSINKMIAIINPNLRFSRNYANIRPHNEEEFCEEYIELLEPSPVFR